MKSGIFKIRLFPSLLLVALVALTFRVSDVISGVDLLSEAALAQDTGQNGDSDDNSDETANADTEQPGEVNAAPPPIVVGLPSSEEDQIITQLRQRREQLDDRARQLDLQAQLLQSTEKKIEDKIIQLQELEIAIKEHLRLFDEREDGQLKSIVEVYEKMKPKDAAPRFEALPLQTQLDLVTRMKSAKVALLMEKMSPEKASTLTKELATRAAPPSIQEVQRGG